MMMMRHLRGHKKYDFILREIKQIKKKMINARFKN